jgi:uncharacterized transporter YbjL
VISAWIRFTLRTFFGGTHGAALAAVIVVPLLIRDAHYWVATFYWEVALGLMLFLIARWRENSNCGTTLSAVFLHAVRFL